VGVTHRPAQGGAREPQEQTVTNPANGSASGDEARKPIAVFLLDDHEIVR
jgi:hypothetical protein